jgi:hypothetical protein
MNQDDQRRRRDDAKALLRRPSWNDEDIDHAAALHDLLETPDGEPDPAAAALRRRLAPELNQRFERSGHLIDLVRTQIFSSGWLGSLNAFERRLCVLIYLGFVSFMGFEAGALGQLDRAISLLLELDRAVQEGGPPARALLGSRYDSALINLASACYVRYDSRRDLLHLDQTPDAERGIIKTDLDRALDASRRVVQMRDSPSREAAIALLGSCYVRLYEDDEQHEKPRTIDSAIALLQDAVRLAGTGRGPGEIAQRVGITDRLAGALLIRNRRPDVDTAIELLTQIRPEATSIPAYNAAGGAGTLATARLRRWMHTRSPADRKGARSAYIDAFATAVAAHPPTAVDIATQWGGWAWSEGWWAEAGEAYSRAMQVLHLAVRRQASRSDRELILRKAPGVAAMAALGLARDGAEDAALVALETGRAVLLAETFDRRSLDCARIATLAGQQKADRYQLLTTEMTRLEALLLAGGPRGGSQVSADLEATRQERFALVASLGSSVTTALSDLEQPPTLAELRAAAGPAPVVYLAATPNGGIALILRAGEDRAVEPVELPQLTTGAAAGMVAALEQAVAARDTGGCDQVCEALWSLAMHSILPKLSGVLHAVVIPGGRLSALPWHAARVPGRPSSHVLDQLALSYMPNVRSLHRARTAWNNAAHPLRALAIGQPMPSAAAPLWTDPELAAVSSHDSEGFQVTRLPGTEATVAALHGAMSRFQVIHFAGHATAVPDDPLASAMIMAQDQRLTVRDLLVRGTGTARFAVLSACNTANVKDPLSDEIVNFPTALLQCGFSGVVGSLWTSYDKPSTMIMDIFYREWQDHHARPPEALRSAQKWTRDHGFGSPLAWANFVYVGP